MTVGGDAGKLPPMIITHTGATPGLTVWASLMVTTAAGTFTPVETKSTVVKTDGSWSLGLHSQADLPTVQAGSFWVVTEPIPGGAKTWSVIVTGAVGTTAVVSSLTAGPAFPPVAPGPGIGYGN